MDVFGHNGQFFGKMKIPQQPHSPFSSSGSLRWYFTDCPYCCHFKRAAVVLLLGSMAALLTLLEDVSLVKPFTQSNHHGNSVTKTKTLDLVNQNQEKLEHESFQLLSCIQRKSNTLLSSFENNFNDLPYTSYKAVLENGFPLQWDDCVVPKAIFHHHQNSRQTGNSQGNTSSSYSPSLPDQKRPFRIVLMGGSASSQSPRNCRPQNETGVQQGLYSKRYSNRLEKALNRNFFSEKLIFQVENMAQGATDSGFTAWLLDQFVDPTNVDLIVWEFAVNDIASNAVSEGLELWFQRAAALFALANQSRLPPIIMLYLWDAYINNEENQKSLQLSQVKDSIPRNYSSSALRQQWETIQYYKSRVGWDIQIIHVGATIDVKAVLQEPSILFSDRHHPSCKGSQVFISMIQYVLYRNIASCKIQFGGTSNFTDANTTGIPLMTALSLDEGGKRVRETAISNMANIKSAFISTTQPSGPKQSRVLDHLSHSSNKIRVASFTLWEPRLGLQDSTYGSLKIAGNVSSLNKFVVMAARWSGGRADKKYSLRLPPCGPNHANTNNLEITLDEPTLQWIGLRYGGGGYTQQDRSRVGGVLDLSINSVHVFGGNDTTSPNNINHARFSGTDIGPVPTWVYIPDILENNEAMTFENQSYTISLCQHANIRNAFIHQIIGVMKPQLVAEHSHR